MEISHPQYPNFEQMYASLCAAGDQFPDRPGVVALDGLSFEHPRKGTRPIEADMEALAMAVGVYADDEQLRLGLQRHGRWGPVDGLRAAGGIVNERMRHGLVWGFSGFATAGRPYHDEAAGMLRLYDHLAEIGGLPSLVVDGGQGDGVLGLSNLIAQRYGVPSMGFVPRQGLKSVGASDYCVVWGNTFAAREQAVGTVPDILVCVGGGEGTRRECEQALRHGSCALLLVLKPADQYRDDSFPKTYERSDEVQKGLLDGRMRVCTAAGDIAPSISTLLRRDFQTARALRAEVVADVFRRELFEQPEK